MAERARCVICDRDFPSADALAMHNGAKHPIQEQTKKSSKKIYFIIISILIVITAGYFLMSAKSTGDSINNPSGNNEIQKITIGFNGNYFPNTIKVKANQPVEITLDNSVRGCYRSFNIKSLGVSGYSSNPSQTITFIPTQKGSFEFACGMHMGTGTIIVE